MLHLLMGNRFMKDDSSTFGLNRKKLSKLWQIGKDVPQQESDFDDEQKKGELLQAQLSESLPLDASMGHFLPNMFSVVCKKFKPFMDCSIEHLLLDPGTDISIIKIIKDLHKKRAESAPTELEQEIAAIVYYTAIASALVNHDIRITKLSYKDMSQSFVELYENNWIIPNLKNLFSKANEKCIKQLNK